MKEFEIHPTDKSFQGAIQEKIDNLNKPKGSLGRLEELAMQVCLIQQMLEGEVLPMPISPKQITRQPSATQSSTKSDPT